MYYYDMSEFFVKDAISEFDLKIIYIVICIDKKDNNKSKYFIAT